MRGRILGQPASDRNHARSDFMTACKFFRMIPRLSPSLVESQLSEQRSEMLELKVDLFYVQPTLKTRRSTRSKAEKLP